ncbi:unnamed protein product [Phytomonas sp. EM1]|nr:unnamed protein product [Phytomonas sp. EM1]|eukprot:CCW63557.1 unnamed protein product [Phytomonas sp. isolate EM1]
MWCCDAPFGSRCIAKDANSRSSSVCSPDALLSSPGMTCSSLCYASNSDCESCVKKKWCYFCLSSRTCQPPEDSCTDNAVVQTCGPDDYDSKRIAEDRFYAIVVIFTAGGIIVVSILGIAAALIYRGLMERRRAREIAEQQQRRRMQRDNTTMLMHEVWDRSAPSQVEERERLLPEGAELRQDRALEVEDGDLSNNAVSRTSSLLADEPMCYLCLSARPSVTFLPCYHTCCCELCSNRLRPVSNTIVCPFCREEIKSMVSLTNVLKWSPEEKLA